MYVDFYHCFWRLIDFPSWCVLHDGSSIYFIYKALSCKHLVEFIVSPRWSNRITWVTTPLHLGANALSPRWNNKRRQTKDKHSGLYVFFPVITKSKAWREIHKRPNAYSSSINLTDASEQCSNPYIPTQGVTIFDIAEYWAIDVSIHTPT